MENRQRTLNDNTSLGFLGPVELKVSLTCSISILLNIIQNIQRYFKHCFVNKKGDYHYVTIWWRARKMLHW